MTAGNEAAEWHEWLLGFLSPAQVRRLQALDVQRPAGSTSLADLLIAWRAHVLRLQRETSLPDDDPTAWGVHDLIAAAHLRSTLARALDQADDNDHAALTKAVHEVDATYRAFTEPVAPGRLAAISGDDWVRDEWWWSRLPQTGPVRNEFERSSPRP